MLLYMAFMMGLAGSLHCLGMCGPIAFALPVRTNILYLKLLKYAVYNMGRVMMYALLGAMIGMAGKGLALLGLQQILSVSTGIIMILSVVIVHFSVRSVRIQLHTQWIKETLKKSFQYYFKRPGYTSLFMLGLLNGLLPCGMVYIAMFTALTAGNTLLSAGYMAVFGLGTMPMMLSVSLLGTVVDLKWRKRVHYMMPVLACMVGVLLILRGLQIDVPVVSSHDCCHIQHTH